MTPLCYEIKYVFDDDDFESPKQYPEISYKFVDPKTNVKKSYYDSLNTIIFYVENNYVVKIGF